MKRLVFLVCTVAFAQTSQQPSIKPTAEETRQIQAKTDELDVLVQKLKTKRGNEDLVADVEVYVKAGRMLLEFPEDFFTQDGIALEKSADTWRVVKSASTAGLHKTHALQGPIDAAFLNPFLLVRPTGTPWNEAVNRQALRTLARFDRLYAKFFRAHPRVVDDKDVTLADFAKYNVVLFGDPGSNRWIAKMNGNLPVTWTRESVSLGGQKFPSVDSFPALVYPNPLSPSHYVVLNTGLTMEDREYRGDYGMPRLGDFAVLKVNEGADVGDVAYAGLFDEAWK